MALVERVYCPMLKNLTDKNFWTHALLATCILGLLAGYLFLLSDFKKVKDSISSQVSTQTNYLPGGCDELCKAQIEAELQSKLNNSYLSNSPSPLPSSSPTAQVVQKSGTSASQTKTTTYIPFSGPFSTTNTDWTNVPGAEAYVDLKNNYNVNAYVTFEASIRANGGGEVHARLFDSTHSIAVDGSEVSTTVSGASTLVSSGKLNLWSGNNLYAVQIKSLNSFNVTFDSARIKLVY